MACPFPLMGRFRAYFEEKSPVWKMKFYICYFPAFSINRIERQLIKIDLHGLPISKINFYWFSINYNGSHMTIQWIDWNQWSIDSNLWIFNIKSIWVVQKFEVMARKRNCAFCRKAVISISLVFMQFAWILAFSSKLQKLCNSKSFYEPFRKFLEMQKGETLFSSTVHLIENKWLFYSIFWHTAACLHKFWNFLCECVTNCYDSFQNHFKHSKVTSIRVPVTARLHTTWAFWKIDLAWTCAYIATSNWISDQTSNLDGKLQLQKLFSLLRYDSFWVSNNSKILRKNISSEVLEVCSKFDYGQRIKTKSRREGKE